MPTVLGFDHIYLAVSDLARSEAFYDTALKVLEFRKNDFELGGERHAQYYNRHFGIVLRPARIARDHQPYAPGLHHLCLRVESDDDVRRAAAELRAAGIHVTDPASFPEYAADYVACFLTDPDGIRLEITNYRRERRQRHDQWDSLPS